MNRTLTPWPWWAKIGVTLVVFAAALGLLLPRPPIGPPAALPAASVASVAAPSASSETASVPSSCSVEPPRTEPRLPVPSAGGSASLPAAPAIYRTLTSIPLTHAAHGFDGTLRLLEDSRSGRPATGEPMRETPGFLHARLELLDPAGRPVDASELWTVVAQVRAGPTRGSFFVKLDPECFASSYCGPDTEIVDVRAGKLGWVESVEAGTGKKQRISMRDSVMAGWRLSPAGPGKPVEIFQVISTQRVTAFVRYTLEGDAWVKRYKQRQGPDPPGNPGNEEAPFALGNFPVPPPAAGR